MLPQYLTLYSSNLLFDSPDLFLRDLGSALFEAFIVQFIRNEQFVFLFNVMKKISQIAEELSILTAVRVTFVACKPIPCALELNKCRIDFEVHNCGGIGERDFFFEDGRLEGWNWHERDAEALARQAFGERNLLSGLLCMNAELAAGEWHCSQSN